MNSIAIIADIISSKKNIKDFDKAITKKFIELSEKYRDIILTNIVKMKGDEVQVLINYEKIDDLFVIIRELKLAILPMKMKMGIGIGNVYNYDLSDNSFSPFDLNGPAFYNARSAFEQTKKKTKGEVSNNSYIMFESKDKQVIKDINLFMNLYDKIINKWKWEMYKIALYSTEDLIQEEIAEKLMIDKKYYEFERLLVSNISVVGKNLTVQEDYLTKYEQFLEDELSDDYMKYKKNLRSDIARRIKASSWYEVKELEELIVRKIKENAIL